MHIPSHLSSYKPKVTKCCFTQQKYVAPGKIPLNPHDYFLFQDLGSRCQGIMVHQLTVNNALELFHLAMLHRGQDLKKKALQMIATNFQAIKSSEEWIQIEQDQEWIPGFIEIMDYMSKLI